MIALRQSKMDNEWKGGCKTACISRRHDFLHRKSQGIYKISGKLADEFSNVSGHHKVTTQKVIAKKNF